jgi:hypothetical protein
MWPRLETTRQKARRGRRPDDGARHEPKGLPGPSYSIQPSTGTVGGCEGAVLCWMYVHVE